MSTENSAAEPANQLAPALFSFSLPEGRLQGAAFSLSFKLVTLAVVLGCAGWLAYLAQAGRLDTRAGSGLGWILAALAMMGYIAWHVLRSRTTLDEQVLHQSWVWDKQVPVRELVYAKLIRIPGLDWLIAPRLYVRTLGGKFTVFYAADPQLVAQLRRLQDELTAWRLSR